MNYGILVRKNCEAKTSISKVKEDGASGILGCGGAGEMGTDADAVGEIGQAKD